MSNIGKNMDKAYDASLVENRIYDLWMKSGYFTPENLPHLDLRTEAFTIVLPPPNVTGTLHIGHAVMLAIEDALVRYYRMAGKRALWVPGTDHAAIATESKVEKLLIEQEGKTRHDLGREAFLHRVNAFAQESHDTIVNQMKKMGASVDWSREAYTLDDARNLAVRTAFVKMYEDGLIYRGHRVVNWDPTGQTTVSDDEVEYKEGTATLYTFRYGKEFPIAISTTRPETKVGDTAVAVHPDDARYAEFVGQEYRVLFAGVELSIKIIADTSVDPNFGTGALGVTPAHSAADAELARVHGLPMLPVIGKDGLMMREAGPLVAGKTTREARKALVTWLREEGLLEREEEVAQNLSVAQRSGGVIEPLPMEQWFIDVNKPFAFHASATHPLIGFETGDMVTLKQLMQHVVRSEQIRILPERFLKTYFHWIDHLRDWNISRQIWFGHRVPVWYRGEDMYVGVEAPEGEGWVQDPDTLDTWFSSGTWTFSVFGWPHETEDLNMHHPTSVLETGYDILPFWVARMILMSTYLLGQVPFRDVYLHGLVRDEQGRKMSKSLGNVINPLDTISEFGADATRLSLLIGSTPGNDSKLSIEKIASYRNFTNKLWNMSRFVFGSVEHIEHIETVEGITLADRWILGRLSLLTETVTKHFEAYEFSLLGEALREFTWNEFADWYLEIAKIQKREPELVATTDRVLLFVLERLLALWHPFMPFVTEEVYAAFEQDLLMVRAWPTPTHGFAKQDREDMALLQGTVTALRNLRAEYRVEYTKPIDLILVDAERLKDSTELIRKLAAVHEITFTHKDEKPPQSASAVVENIRVYVPLAGMIDIEAERARLQKELAEVRRYMTSLQQMLANEQFRANAHKEVIAQKEELLAHATARETHLHDALLAL